MSIVSYVYIEPTQNLHNPSNAIRSMGCHQQMYMVSHRHKRVQVAVEILEGTAKLFEVETIISLFIDNRLPIIAPLYHKLWLTGQEISG